MEHVTTLRHGSGCSVGSVVPGYNVFVLESHPRLRLERTFNFYVWTVHVPSASACVVYTYSVRFCMIPYHVHTARV